MAFKTGSTFTVNVKFQGTFNKYTTTRVYYSYSAGTNYDAMEWDLYASSAIVAAGSNMDMTGHTAHRGPFGMGQFVPPVNCRLIGLACSVDIYNPYSGFTNLRLGVIKAVFDDQSSATDDAVWTSLGYIDTTTQSGDPAGLCMFNSTTFNSSNGDVSAGDTVGFGAQALGAHAANTYGVITAVFRVL